MTGFEKWLMKNMPRLGCALYAFKHSSDRDYFQRAIRTDSLILKCESFGDKNPDRNIYMIRMGDRNNGFFAEYHKLLKYLYYSDRFHLTPVVRFTDAFLYSEDHPVNGTGNPFEYYFDQPGGISTGSADESRNVFRAEHIHTMISDLIDKKKNDYEVTDEYVKILGDIASRYIRLNKDTEKIIGDAVKEIGADDHTIGVHYRGTDFKRGLKDHPRFVPIEEYRKKVSALLDRGDYDKVFLASDSKEALSEFKSAFDDRLVYFDNNTRSGGDVSVAFSGSERKDHHYLLGLEVLRDMMVLSGCGALVAGLSQVSLAARITKASKKEEYKDLEIISKGISYDAPDGRKYYKEYGNK